MSERESVLVIDEIYEWNLNQKTLIAIVKEKVKKEKVVIMSATAQYDELQRYFGDIFSVGRVDIPGRMYPVSFHKMKEDETINCFTDSWEYACKRVNLEWKIRNHEGKKVLTQKGEAILQKVKEFVA